MIEVTIKIDDIDYDAMAELLLPIIAEQIANGNNPMLKRLFSGEQRLSVSTAKSFISMMPQEKKDKLIVAYLNGNRNKFVQHITTFAAKNGIHLKVKDIKADKK